MIITYHGLQNFRVQFGDTVLAFDPPSKESRYKAGSFGADIALSSLNHPDMNGVGQASRGEKRAFIVNGPGEYEVQGIFIKGVPSVSRYGLSALPRRQAGDETGGKEKINTIYSVHLENMTLCFLGALSSTEISTEAKNALDTVDILFAPVDTLGPSASCKFAVSLEPSIIIPMHYDEKSLKAFLKEGGEEEVKSLEKLTVKRKDLEEKKGEIVVLQSQ